MKSVVIKDKKVFARIYFCTKYTNKIISKENFIENITKDIKDTSVGYAGFSKKQHLRNYLRYQIFDNDDSLFTPPKSRLDKREITETSEEILKIIKEEMPSQQTRIYIFPSFSTFIKKKMDGVSGYTPWKDTILIFIDPTSNWKKQLKKTIAHEYIHSLSRQHHKWETLQDSIVFEGLAENYVQHLFKDKLSPWSSSLSLNETKKYFKKIQSSLNSKEWSVYSDVFFKDETYPLWTGYSVGYQLVKAYIDKQDAFSWQEVLKIKPSKILKKSLFE